MVWNTIKRRSFREAQRKLVQQAKDRPCVDCGKAYPYYVMDLDHRPGEKKLYVINKMPGRHGTQRIKDEIAKCDAVCANCHRERTYQRG